MAYGRGGKAKKSRKSDMMSGKEEVDLDELGRISDGEDEEIEEDDAFNSEDEQKYGQIFASVGKRGESDSDGESGQDNEEDLDDDDEGGKTLLDMMSDDDEVEEEDEDEDDEDEDDEDEEDEDEDDSDEDDSDEDEGMDLNVAGLVDKIVATTSDETRARLAVARANQVASKDGEFAGSKKLSLEDMIGSLEGHSDYGTLKKRLEQLEDTTRISERAAGVIEQRAERKAGYEKVTEEMGKWKSILQENRFAKHQTFGSTARPKSTSGAVAASFEATTDLEKEIQAALEDSGLVDEESMRESETKHMLEVNQVDPEVLKERQAELAKLRVLMFYGEQKARRAKKIKSKMYRRLKKKRDAKEEEKELAHLREVDPEAVKELEEKAALERARERMTLKHKNNSKFIRGLLKHGGAKNAHTRDIINEQILEEQRLKKRMSTMRDDGDESDSDSGHSPEEQARRLAEQIEQDEVNAAKPPAKGLFALQFMQRGLAKQREEARKEVEFLDKAMASGTVDEEEEESNEAKGPVSRRKLGPKAGVSSRTKPEEAQVDEDGNKVPLENVNGDAEGSTEGSKNLSAKTTDVVRVRTNPKRKMFDAPNFPGTGVSQTISSHSETTEEKAQVTPVPSSNPWLSVEAATTGRTKDNSSKISANVKEQEVRVDLNKSLKETKNSSSKGKNGEDDAAREKRKVQAQLIKRAFAGTGVLQEDFAKEKEAEETTREELLASKETTMYEKPGWGSWAGNGIKAKKPKVKKPVVIKSKKRKAAQNVILSNKRNKKVAKYLVEKLPYPFTSRAQYEQSLKNPLGSDWNTMRTYAQGIKPSVLTRNGNIIDPIEAPTK